VGSLASRSSVLPHPYTQTQVSILEGYRTGDGIFKLLRSLGIDSASNVFFLKFGGTMPLFLFIFHILRYTYIHLITFIQHICPSPFAEVSLHLFIALKLSGKTFLWCRAENRTQACLVRCSNEASRAGTLLPLGS